MEYYSAIKKGNPATCANTDEPGGHFVGEISQIKKYKYCIIYMQNLKQTKNDPIETE